MKASVGDYPISKQQAIVLLIRLNKQQGTKGAIWNGNEK